MHLRTSSILLSVFLPVFVFVNGPSAARAAKLDCTSCTPNSSIWVNSFLEFSSYTPGQTVRFRALASSDDAPNGNGLSARAGIDGGGVGSNAFAGMNVTAQDLVVMVYSPWTDIGPAPATTGSHFVHVSSGATSYTTGLENISFTVTPPYNLCGTVRMGLYCEDPYNTNPYPDLASCTTALNTALNASDDRTNTVCLSRLVCQTGSCGAPHVAPTVTCTSNGVLNPTITAGSNVTFAWTPSANATSCRQSWDGTPLSTTPGSITIPPVGTGGFPASATAYIRGVVCDNAYGAGTCSTSITATAAAPTATLTATPNTVAPNGRATLTWGSGGSVTSCTAGGPWSNQASFSGSGLTDPLTTATTFTFQCTGPGGTSALQSVTVNVSAAPTVNVWFN